MKKLAITVVALAAMVAVTAVAVAQYALPNTKLTASATPKKAGTKKKPKNTQVKLAASLDPNSNRTASAIVFFLPKEMKMSFKGFRFCPASQILNEGVGSCPKGSKIGSGTANAVLGPSHTPLPFTVTIYAGSPTEAALSLAGPSAVPPLQGLITNAGGDFGQKMTIPIPSAVQQPVTGVYANIVNLSATIGKATGSTGKGKKKKKTFAVSQIGCPKDKTWDFMVRLSFAPNPNPPSPNFDEARATVACTR